LPAATCCCALTFGASALMPSPLTVISLMLAQPSCEVPVQVMRITFATYPPFTFFVLPTATLSCTESPGALLFVASINVTQALLPCPSSEASTL
jgi:hypothetical protein